MDVEGLDEEVEGARQAAARRVAEWLTVPDDLQSKLPKLRANVHAGQLATDAQLRALVQVQLDSARTGLDLLRLSLGRIANVQANLSAVDKLCAETQGLIGQYELIKAVNDARTNLHYTRRQLDRTLEIPRKIEEIHDMLENEKNLLQVYNEIKKLEKMREGALHEARGNTEQYEVLEEVFKDVPGMFEVFEEKLYDLTRQTITLAKERPSVLVKALQVVEREHKLWEARAAAKGKKKSKKDKRNDIDPREKIKEHIRISVGERFRQVFADCGEDVQKIISRSALLSEDLDVVVHQVVPCFPEHFNIDAFFVEEYHQRLKAMFSEFAQQADDLSTQEILVLVEWVHKSYEPQMKALGAKEVADSLMDVLEPLMLSYKADAAKMMNEWTGRLIEQDKQAEPDQLDGLFYTDAPVLLFKFINQQIDVVRPTACPRFIGLVAEECLTVLERYQKALFHTIRKEVDSLYMENILAMINNNHKCHDYLQDLGRKLAKALEADAMAKLNINGVAGVFYQIAEEAIKTVVAIIFKDLEPALVKIFHKDWYEDDLIEAIVETVKDYYDNECIKGYIVDSALRKMSQLILDQLVYRYVAEMVSRKSSFEKRTVKRMQDDEQAIHDFFVKDGDLREKQVAAALQILFDLRQIVECDATSVVENFAELLKHSPDITMDTFAGLLARRPDLSKAQIKELAEACAVIHQKKQLEREALGGDGSDAKKPSSGEDTGEEGEKTPRKGGLFTSIQEAQASGVTSFAKVFSLVSNVNIKSKK